MTNIGELTQARNRSLSIILNRAGSLNFTIPMDDELGQLIYPLTSAVKAYRLGTTGWRMIWSGYVNTIDEDPTNNRMTVNCKGWFGRLEKRILRSNKTYTDTDDGDIILDLLQEVNGSPVSPDYEFNTRTFSYTASDTFVVRWPTTTRGPNTPTYIKRTTTSKLPNEGSGGATAYVAARRTMTYARYQTVVWQAIEQLTELENGCDVWIDPETRILYIYRKKQRILPSVVFSFQWGPGNIAQFGRQLDGETVVNYFLAIGGASTTPAYQADTTSMDLYGPIEEIATLGDLTGSNANNVLQAYAAGEVAIRSLPRQLHSITPFQHTDGGPVPEPFVDYGIGDQVAFIAKHGRRININQQVRIFGLNISIDEEGNEKISSMQIYPGG